MALDIWTMFCAKGTLAGSISINSAWCSSEMLEIIFKEFSSNLAQNCLHLFRQYLTFQLFSWLSFFFFWSIENPFSPSNFSGRCYFLMSEWWCSLWINLRKKNPSFFTFVPLTFYLMSFICYLGLMEELGRYQGCCDDSSWIPRALSAPCSPPGPLPAASHLSRVLYWIWLSNRGHCTYW